MARVRTGNSSDEATDRLGNSCPEAMRQTLLYQRYPVLYRGRKRLITESLMSLGIERRDGWFDLLDRLSVRIEARALERPARGTRETDVRESEQVKEKYGTLRFYLAASDDDFDRWILEVEDESEGRELCGIAWRARRRDVVSDTLRRAYANGLSRAVPRPGASGHRYR